MKKIFTLIAAAMLALGANADTAVLTAPSSASSTHSDAEGIITLTDGSANGGGIQVGVEMTYSGTTATAMKLSGSRNFTLAYKDGVTINKVTLYGTSNGTSTATIGTGSKSDASSLGTLPTRGSTPAQIDITGVTGLRGSAQFQAIIVVEYTSTLPSLTVSPKSLDFATSPLEASQTKTITVTGKNLTAGTTGTITLPNLAGLSVEPSTFTVGADGKVNQEVAVTYASTADVPKASTSIGISIESLSASVDISYFSRAALIEQTTVSQETTWNWEALSETVELTETSTPKKTDTFVFANIDYLINFGSFKASDIVISEAVYPSRAGKFQDGTIGFKTSTTGTIVVDFSDTGKSGTGVDRYLYVNGTKTNYSTKRDGSSDDRKETGEIEIAAGNVTINAMTEDTENPGQMKRAAICVYSVKFTPKPTTNPIPAATGIKGVEAETTAAPAVKKYVENGQVVIEKAGKKFTVAGAQLK